MGAKPKPFVHRQKLTQKDCKEIFDEAKYNGNIAGKNLCLRKGYEISTFYKCLRNEGVLNPLWKHPPHCNKWNDDLIDKACNLIGQNPLLTLEEILIEMQNKYNAPEISLSTLSSYLNFSLITLKNITFHPTARNSDTTKEKRVKYGEFFIQHSDYNFFFIDEVGYSICVQRNRGRSLKGTQAIAKLPLSKTLNCSCCMAITDSEVLYYKKKQTAYDGESFQNFLKELIEIIESRGFKNVILVMDNSSVHQEKYVKQLCDGKVDYMFLPPYSPNLNPIENVFGIIKKYMKKILATTYRDALLATFHLDWGQKTAARQSILDEVFTLAVSQIDQEILENTYEHMKKYVALALEKQDI